jgi:hypothetical protein
MTCWEMQTENLKRAARNAGKTPEELKAFLRKQEKEKGHEYAESLFKALLKKDAKAKKKEVAVAYA